MAIWSRIRSRHGQTHSVIHQVSSVSDLPIPDDVNTFEVTGTTKVNTLSTRFIEPGREIVIIGTDAAGSVFDTIPDTTVSGEMDLGGALTTGDITVAATDVLRLTQTSTGSWLNSGYTDN